MKTLGILFCLATLASCQTKNENGNPTGEIGSPAFDEIVVESTLTVRGKPGSRGGKSLAKQVPDKAESKPETMIREADAILERPKRVPDPKRGPGGGYRFGGFNNALPGSSSSAAQASSNSFDSQSPLGSFGASASQTSSQSQNFGPHGFGSSAAQSASQTYRLPNGNTIDVSFSSGFGVQNGRPSFSNGQSITVTRPDGSKHQLYK